MAVALIGAIGWTGAAALTIGSAVYLRREYKKQKAEAERKARESVQSRTSMELNIRQDPADARRFGYGTARYGGTMLFAHVATNNLYLISAVASFCRLSTDYVIVGEDFIPWEDFEYSTTRTEFFTVEASSEFAKYREKLFISPTRLYAPTTSYSGTGINELDSWIINTHAQNMFSGGNWTFNKIQYHQIHLVYDNDVFPHGMPQISFILRRRDDAGFSLRNPALCIQDYLLNKYYGLGLSASDLDSTSFTAARVACQTAVVGGVRFETHIVFSTDEKPVDILNKLLDTCNGSLTFSNGKWHLNVGVWRTPVLDLDESDMRSDLTVTARRGRAEIFNQVTGLITGADGQPKDVPVYNNTGYQTEDGEEINTDITLDGVRAIHQATRIFRQRLEQNRHEITCSGVFGPRAVNLIPGENIRLSYARYGWANKYFEVVDYQRLQATDGVFDVKLILQETDPSIFDEADTPPEYAALETNLPDGRTVTAPSNLTITEELRLVGDVVEAWVVANWTVSTDIFVRGYDFRFILAGETEYIDYGRVGGNNIDFVMPYVGEFTFEVRAVNTMGVGSEWITVTQEILGKTAPPENVTGLSGLMTANGYLLTWTPVSDLDLFEYWVQETMLGSAIKQIRVKSSSYLAPFFVLPEGSDSETWFWQVWAFDTSNISSLVDAGLTLEVSRPEAPPNFSAQGIGSKVVMNWEEPGSSYPIKEYRIWKKRTAGGISRMIPIAKVSASYFVNEEFAAGSYSFGVSAVDMAGNESAINKLEDDIIVLAPMGFTSYLEKTVYFDETGWDGVTIDVDSGIPNAYSLLFTPADIGQPELPDPSYRYIVAGIRRTDKSFAERMTELGLTNFQDAVDAGYGKYMEPMYETLQQTFLMTPSPGRWIDLGFVTKMAAVSVALNYREFGGQLATSEIIRSEVFKGNYGATSPQIFQTSDFYAGDWQRFFSKLRITPKPDTVRIIESLTIKISLALIDYSGVDEADETDALGTFITFSDSYNYVVSLTATPQGSTDIHIVVAEEAATPITGFYVFAFDSAGDRVTANFYWTVKGY